MKRGSLALAAALAALSLAGCGGVRVRHARTDLGLSPRPADCGLEFLQRPPARAFEEIADLETHVTSVPRGGAAEALRAKACELGADAVVVTQEFVTNPYGHTLVAGTAIKYVLEAPKPERQDAPAAGKATDL